MPVLITIDGKPELWGGPRLGLSSSERQDYDELHARHRADDRSLHEALSGDDVWLVRAMIASPEVRRHREREIKIRYRSIEDLCRSVESTRRVLRKYLVAPDITLEWVWRFWVGRELGALRGTGCVDITPGVRSSWGSEKFSYRPGLTREERNHAEILLEEWSGIVEDLRRDGLPPNLST